MAILGLIVTGIFTLVIAVLIFELLRRLFWLALRLAASVAAAFTGGIAAVGLAAPDVAWIAVPVAFVAGAVMLRANRGWGREPHGLRAAIGPAGKQLIAESDRPVVTKMAVQQLANTVHVSLISPALGERLVTTENALARAARDDLGQSAAEWLAFWRRRVPDLIAAAQNVWDDAGLAEQIEMSQRLGDNLDSIIGEADRRLVAVRAARRDLFTTRANHAAARVREG